jgi:hypothetical protein
MKTLSVTFRSQSGRKVEITCTQDVAKSIARALYPDWVPYAREDKEHSKQVEAAIRYILHDRHRSKIEFLVPGTDRREQVQVMVDEADAELVWKELQKAGWQMLELERNAA